MKGADPGDLERAVVGFPTSVSPLVRQADVPVSEHAILAWSSAIGQPAPEHGSGIAPDALLQSWTMPVGNLARLRSPTLHALVRDAARTAGLGAVVATDYEQEYGRPIRVGELLLERSWIEAVSPRKTTSLGVGHFVTIALEIVDEQGAVAGRLRTRTLYYDTASAAPGVVAVNAGPDDEPVPGDGPAPWEIPLSRTLIISASLAANDHEPVHHDHEVARAQGLRDIITSIVTTAGLVLRYANEHAALGARPRRLRMRLASPAYPGDVLAFRSRTSPADDSRRLTVRGDHVRGRHVTASVDLVHR